MKALAENQSLPLKRLVVKWMCTLTDAARDSLAQFISNAITLQYIVIWCTPSAHELLELARAMYDKSTLREKSLEVFGCRANSDDEAKDLAQLLVEYPRNVVFANHNAIMITQIISDAGAVALAQALHHNSTLEKLDLSNNSIGDAGAVYSSSSGPPSQLYPGEAVLV